MCLMCLLLATLPSMGLFWFFLRINSRWKCDKLINYLVEVWLLVGFSVIRPTVFQYGSHAKKGCILLFLLEGDRGTDNASAIDEVHGSRK